MADQIIKKHEFDKANNNNNTDINTFTTHNDISSSSPQTIAGENLSKLSPTTDKKIVDEVISTVLPDGQIQDFSTPKDIKDKDKDKNTNDNTTHFFTTKKEDRIERLSKMESLLCQSYDILANYFTTNFVKEHGIPYHIFSEARAIMFISYWKAGLVVGGTYGSGILLSRWNNQWSGPCAITLGGCDIGFEIGVEKLDCVLIINHDSILRFFENKGVLAIGADASVALGPFGKDINLITQGTDSIYTYSFAKGGYLGLSLQSGLITVSNDCNKDYYSKPVAAHEIIYNKVEIPHNKFYSLLIHSLDQYGLNRSTNTNNIIDNSNIINTTTTDTNTTNLINRNDNINDNRSINM